MFGKPLCEVMNAMGAIIDRHAPSSERSNSAKGGDRYLSPSFKGLARHRGAVIEGTRQRRYQCDQYLVFGCLEQVSVSPKSI